MLALTIRAFNVMAQQVTNDTLSLSRGDLEKERPRGFARVDARAVEVVAPNFKRRLSGVTATLERVVPVQARTVRIAALGPVLANHVPQIRFTDLLQFWKAPAGRSFRIWHARRNVEMLAGLVMQYLLRMPLRLVFTSASQRKHTLWSRFLISRMDEVISTSQKTASYLRRPSVVIRHGIDPEQFYPVADRQEARAKLGLPALRLVGCCGRIRRQKGTDVFVEAMIRVLPKHPDWGAAVLGRAEVHHLPFLRHLKSIVRKAGLENRIVFQQEVPPSQTPDWYRALDVFVAPQRWEGFGVTPLEGMASGLPVVATTVGAFPELVVPGVTGELIPPGDVPAMAEALERLLNNPQQVAKLGAQARQHVCDTFSITGEADAINRVYLGLKR
jgi:mannosyltransferase